MNEQIKQIQSRIRKNARDGLRNIFIYIGVWVAWSTIVIFVLNMGKFNQWLLAVLPLLVLLQTAYQLYEQRCSL